MILHNKNISIVHFNVRTYSLTSLIKLKDLNAVIRRIVFYQFASKDYNLQAGCGIYEKRKPTPQQQPKDLTKKIIPLVG